MIKHVEWWRYRKINIIILEKIVPCHHRERDSHRFSTVPATSGRDHWVYIFYLLKLVVLFTLQKNCTRKIIIPIVKPTLQYVSSLVVKVAAKRPPHLSRLTFVWITGPLDAMWGLCKHCLFACAITRLTIFTWHQWSHMAFTKWYCRRNCTL